MKTHKHKCDSCGLIWKHSEASAGVDWAHECPKCKTEQFDRYFGLAPAKLFHGVLDYYGKTE